jgi:hypothetical protein
MAVLSATALGLRYGLHNPNQGGGMPQASGPGNSVYLEMGIWWDAGQGEIHLTAKNVKGFHSTVNNDPNSKRGHQNLFVKLAKVLKEAGAPHPSVPEETDEKHLQT